MPSIKDLKFIVNPGLNGSGENYVTVVLDTGSILKSWRLSLFSFEWLNKDGTIKTIEQLPENEKPKRLTAENKVKSGTIEQPVLGIGIGDNVEIGIGRAELLTLAAKGYKTIQVHIPKSCESDFKPFISDIK